MPSIAEIKVTQSNVKTGSQTISASWTVLFAPWEVDHAATYMEHIRIAVDPSADLPRELNWAWDESWDPNYYTRGAPSFLVHQQRNMRVAAATMHRSWAVELHLEKTTPIAVMVNMFPHYGLATATTETQKHAVG